QPGERAPTRGRDSVEHDATPQIDAPADVDDRLVSARPEILREDELDVLRENASGCDLGAVARFREERLAVELAGGALDGILERQVLERVQRVVMDEE